MSSRGTVEWIRIILLHKWSGVIGTQHHRQHSRQKPVWWVSVSRCSWCFRQTDERRQLLKASLKRRKIHRQVSGAHVHTSGEASPTARAEMCDDGSALTRASLLEASVGLFPPVSACVSLWALSWAQWELCTGHITLYMQSVWVLLSRECYIAMNSVFTPVTFTPGKQRQQKQKINSSKTTKHILTKCILSKTCQRLSTVTKTLEDLELSLSQSSCCT